MSNHTPDSFLPEKCRILSGSALKMIAMMTMLIDHTGMAILSQLPEAQIPLFFFSGKSRFPFYRGFPEILAGLRLPHLLLFAGRKICHTKNRFRYGRNLLYLRYFLNCPGIIFTQIRSTENKMCFLHYSSGMLVFAQ